MSATRDGASTGSDAWLVVGLGNPGPSYAGTRHNVGYLVADVLVGRLGGRLRAHSAAAAEVLESHLRPGGPRIVVGRSRGYMNVTGPPVAALLKFYRLPPPALIVIQDELDLPFETIRVKFGGGDNGHNGLRSIRASLGTGDYYRVRLGTGRPSGRQAPADFLLSDYSRAEREVLGVQVERAADAVESLVDQGLERTQSQFND